MKAHEIHGRAVGGSTKLGTGSSALGLALGLAGSIGLGGVAHALPADVPGEAFCSAVVASGSDVAVEGRASVDGDVRAVGDVHVGGRGAVSGEVTAADATAAFAAAGEPSGASDLGALVARTGDVALSSGVYRADAVDVTGRARLVVDATAADPVVLFVSGDLRVAGTASINAGGDPAALVLLSAAGGSLALTGNAVVDALLYAPGSSAALAGNARVRGGVVASSVSASGNATVASVESGCVPEPPPGGGDPELLVSRWVEGASATLGYTELLVLNGDGTPHAELPVLASGAGGAGARNTVDRVAVAPGGSDVYYVLNQLGVESSIHVVSPAGLLAGDPGASTLLVDTSMHECAYPGLESTVWNVALSPDGSRMAWGWEGFGGICDAGGSSAWIYTASTQPPLAITRLVWDPVDRFFGVAWGARDGVEELYVHGQRLAGSRLETTIDVFDPVTGSFVRRLFSEIDATGACTGFLCLPLPIDWLDASPDGGSLVFQVQPEFWFVTREQPLAPGVYRLATDVPGAAPELVFPSTAPMGFDLAPSFSPDGASLVLRTEAGLVTVDLSGPSASDLVALDPLPTFADRGGTAWADVLP